MTLYTAPYCPKCELAQQKLNSKHIVFTVTHDEKDALAAGINVVPCLVSDKGNKYGLKEIILICEGDGNFV